METSDNQIIEAVLAGRPERFDELVQRHSRPLWGTIRLAVSNPEDAREILQETWLRGFERLASLRDPGRLRSWLVSIALNQVRQLHRRATRQGSQGERRASAGPEGGGAEEDPLERIPDESAEEIGEALVRQEEVETMKRHIHALPPRQRQVLDLRLNHELAHGEIAELLDISPDSSRANYYQAVRKLREVDLDSPPATRTPSPEPSEHAHPGNPR